MSSPDFLKPGTRPASPASVSWFEFLLKPELLAKHLSHPHAVPGANQLVIQFLQQAFLLENDPKYQDKNAETTRQTDSPMDTDSQPEEKDYHKKKVKALKTLALKTASYAGWDLDSLMSSVPGPLVLQLILELLSATTDKTFTENTDVIEESEADDQELSDHAFFSILLYQRWCLHTVLQDCLPKRPTKSNSISVPGLTELVVQVINVNEEKIAQIKKAFGKCKAYLNQCLKKERCVCMPTSDCFKFANSALNEATLDWESGRKLDFKQWAWQIAYELGSVSFYEADYKDSLALFQQVKNWYTPEEGLPELDQKKFTGYLKACQSLLPGVENDNMSLTCRFDQALAQKDIKALTSILKEDFACRKLPPSTADKVMKMEAMLEAPMEERHKVLCCCLVFNAHKGSPIVHQQEMVDVSATKENCMFLAEVLDCAVSSSTHMEKTNLAGFMRYLVTTAGEPLQSILHSSTTLQSLIKYTTGDASRETDHMDTSTQTKSLLVSSESEEHMLAISYVPDTLWNVLCAIHKKGSINAVRDMWKLPKDLDRLFSELPPRFRESPLDLTTVCAQVLIAKAKELIAIKQYILTEQLLVAAEKTVQDMSTKISKIIRWELLYTYLLTAKTNSATNIELANRVKECLSSLKVESDIYPHDNLVMECVSYLLLCKEWDYLSSLYDTRVGFTEYARQLINVCKELPAVPEARAPGTVLWETTVIICTSQNSGKRIRLGNQAMLPKETFRKFLCTVQEPLVLSVLLSLMTRLYNTKNTDVDIDKINEFSAVWPGAIPPAVLMSVDEPYVKETMLILLKHALSINSSQPSWLKTYAEVQYALGNYKQALKFYIQAANVQTNFFTDSIPTFLVDTEVYKRMVKCCVHLKHYTQASLLAQFTGENDHAQMFKFLQEKDSQDGMDIYYDCIWDISLLEFLINAHGKHGEIEKKNRLMQIIANPELNAYNPEMIAQHVKVHKKSLFFKTLARQYC